MGEGKTVGSVVFGQHWHEYNSNAKIIAVLMTWALVIGLAITGLGAWTHWLDALLWAGACSAIGWTIGFIFGVPRSLSSDAPKPVDPTNTDNSHKSAAEQAAVSKLAADQAMADHAAAVKTAADSPDSEKAAAEKVAVEKAAVAKAAADQSAIDQAAAEHAAAANVAAAQADATKSAADKLANRTLNDQAGSKKQGLQPNTNLEQISDWLTKIVVGVTLVEWKNVQMQLEAAAKIVANSMCDKTCAGSPTAFAYALILYFSFSGFLGSYLLTRLFLQGAFRDADQ